jgi:hypothetical protein
MQFLVKFWLQKLLLYKKLSILTINACAAIIYIVGHSMTNSTD